MNCFQLYTVLCSDWLELAEILRLQVDLDQWCVAPCLQAAPITSLKSSHGLIGTLPNSPSNGVGIDGLVLCELVEPTFLIMRGSGKLKRSLSATCGVKVLNTTCIALQQYDNVINWIMFVYKRTDGATSDWLSNTVTIYCWAEAGNRNWSKVTSRWREGEDVIWLLFFLQDEHNRRHYL